MMKRVLASCTVNNMFVGSAVFAVQSPDMNCHVPHETDPFLVSKTQLPCKSGLPPCVAQYPHAGFANFDDFPRFIFFFFHGTTTKPISEKFENFFEKKNCRTKIFF